MPKTHGAGRLIRSYISRPLIMILASAATDGRPLTRYAANSRSNGAARSGWRMREFGDQGEENGGQCRVQKGITDFGLCRELWTGRKSATSRQRSGT